MAEIWEFDVRDIETGKPCGGQRRKWATEKTSGRYGRVFRSIAWRYFGLPSCSFALAFKFVSEFMLCGCCCESWNQVVISTSCSFTSHQQANSLVWRPPLIPASLLRALLAKPVAAMHSTVKNMASHGTPLFFLPPCTTNLQLPPKHRNYLRHRTFFTWTTCWLNLQF